MYAGWFGTFWAPSSSKVPIVHFGGPLTPKLLRSKEFSIGSERNRLSVAFFNPGRGDGAKSQLSIDALPKNVMPKLKIDWPVGTGAPPLETDLVLSERCC